MKEKIYELINQEYLSPQDITIFVDLLINIPTDVILSLGKSTNIKITEMLTTILNVNDVCMTLSEAEKIFLDTLLQTIRTDFKIS